MTRAARSKKSGRATISSVVTAWITGIMPRPTRPACAALARIGVVVAPGEPVAEHEAPPAGPVFRGHALLPRGVKCRHANGTVAAGDGHRAIRNVQHLARRAGRAGPTGDACAEQLDVRCAQSRE